MTCSVYFLSLQQHVGYSLLLALMSEFASTTGPGQRGLSLEYCVQCKKSIEVEEVVSGWGGEWVGVESGWGLRVGGVVSGWGLRVGGVVSGWGLRVGGMVSG